MQVDFPSKQQSHQYASPRKVNFHHDSENRRIPIQRVSINNPSSYQFRQLNDTPINNTYNARSQRSNPITGLQSSYELEQRRSNSPALSNIIEEDIERSLTPSTDHSDESSIFPRDFNSNSFYQSIFQPEIFTDDSHQRYIEMKLDVKDYNPNDIKVSINDNDLIVQVKNSNFYRLITLPSNIDLTSLSVHHHYDKKLYITIKLLDEHSSFKYI